MNNNNPQTTPIYLQKKTMNPNDSTRRLLIHLFTKYPTKTYTTQKEICNALQEEFGASRKQGSISKALSTLSDTPFKSKGVQYVISKYEGKYRLFNDSDYRNSLRHKLKEASVFSKEVAYFEHGLKFPQTFVFWLNDDRDKQSMAFECFKNMLDGTYLDIFIYQEKLIVMLNPEALNFSIYSDVLQNFFKPHYDIFKTEK